MKKVSLYLIGACAALAATGASVSAQDVVAPSVTTKLDVAYVSKYVWRGIPQTKEGALQPSLTFSHDSGLSLNLWASEDSDAGKVTEHDYTLSYAWAAKSVAMNAGYIYYAFPNTSFLSTSEVYASACFNAPLSPTLSVNYDVDEATGFYASLGVGYTCQMPWSKAKPTNLNLSGKISFASAAYNKFWYGVDKSTLSDIYLSASVPFTMSNKATLTPSLSYSTVINGDLEDSLSGMGLDSDNFVGSLTFSYGF